MSGKIYRHEFPAAGVAVHNRYRPHFHVEMLSERGDHGGVSAPILRRFMNLDDQRAIRGGGHADLLRAWDDFDRKSHY